MAIPDAEGRRNPGKEFTAAAFRRALAVAEGQAGAAVFAALGFFDLAAEVVGNPLHAVADSEHRNAEVKNPRIALRRIGVINRTGPAGKDYARWLELANFLHGGATGQDGRENLLLVDAARDELRILSAEIENHHAAAFGFHRASLLECLPRRCFH